MGTATADTGAELVELNKVPGYTAALRRGYRIEEAYREFSYLDAPEFICGVEARPLTLQMYLQLCAARSPFLVGGRPPFIQDVGVFLFRLSPAYDAAFAAKAHCRSQISDCRSLSRSALDRIARENDLIGRFFLTSSLVSYLEQNVEAIVQNAFKRERDRFITEILPLPFAPAVRAIQRFIDRMLLDKPIASKQKNVSLDPTDTSAAADVIHIIAGAYHWTRDEVLALPMPEVFQSLRNIQRDDKNCPKRARAKVHPFATRLTKKHRAIAAAAALAAARGSEDGGSRMEDGE